MVEVSVQRQAGRVKWFDAQKGWGFIQPADGSDDVFVHQESIQADGFRSLDDGEDVEYETATDSTGRKRAINVSGPGGAPVKGTSRHTGFGGRGRGNQGGSYSGGNQRYGNRYEERGGNREFYTDRNGSGYQSGGGGGNYQGGGYRGEYRSEHQGGNYRSEGGGFRGGEQGYSNGGGQYNNRNDQYRESYRDQSGYRGDQSRYQERQQY